MKKYTDKELKAIAEAEGGHVIIADNGTVFRPDQADYAKDYAKRNECELHEFGGKKAADAKKPEAKK